MSDNAPTQVDRETRTTQLCQWIYGERANAPKVVSFVHVGPARTGLGFGVAIDFHSYVYEYAGLDSDRHGGQKEIWKNLLVEDHDHAQADVQSQVRAGLDPMFQAFKAQLNARALIVERAAALAAVYEKMEMESATPSATTVGGWTAGRL